MADEGAHVAFRGRIRHWDQAAGRGLAVVDAPADVVAALGGRRQHRVTATVEGSPFSGSGMLVAGGGYCIGLSRAVLAAAGVAVGDEVELEIAPA